MAIEYMGLNNIQGPLAVIEGVDDTFYEEMVTVTLDNGEKRIGRVIEISGDKAVIQVFEGTSNLSLTNTKTNILTAVTTIYSSTSEINTESYV